MKFGLAAFPERYVLPARPGGGPAASQDAYRQTSFLLSGDLQLFETTLNLQLRLVAANAKMRSPEAAAIFGLWSRAFSHLADACLLMGRGSYVSCPPLLRTACDCVAAQRSLVRDGFEDFRAWMPDAVRLATEHQAIAFALGRFRGGSVLAEDEKLGTVYRVLTDLSMPHFGATALQTAPDSGLQKLAIGFADGAFHLGWAELIAGWLLTLAAAQTDLVIASKVLTVPEECGEEWRSLAAAIVSSLANTRRCRVEDVDGRFLFHNFRRTASGVPKRVML